MEWTEAAVRWKDLFEEYRNSGTRRKEFCSERGLKLSTFDYWRSRLRKLNEAQVPVVKLTTVKRPTGPIRVRVGERVVVELEGDAGEDQLRRVLRAAAQV